MDFLKTIIKKGLIRILSASVINKVMALIANILIVRIISRTEYGYYGWAYNIVTIFLLFSGLGIHTGVLQFCSENETSEKKLQYYKFGAAYGIIINILLAVSLVIYSSLFPVSMPDARWVLQSMVGIPLLDFIYNYAISYLRSREMNKEYSRMLNIHSLSHLILMISGAYCFGLKGYIIGYYISYFVTLSYVFAVARYDIYQVIRASVGRVNDYISLIKYSSVCACNNGISHLLYVLDIFLIGIYISDADILAGYKASTTIPTAMYFVTSSIILVVYPYFARNQFNGEWIQKHSKQLYLGLFAINIPIGLLLFFGSDIIVSLIYGTKYADAAPIFRVLSVGYIINTIVRMPTGNMLAMLRKVKVNLIIDIVGGLLNIVLDILLIKIFGSIGAAYATVIVITITGLLSYIYFKYYLRNLLNRGIRNECN